MKILPNAAIAATAISAVAFASLAVDAVLAQTKPDQSVVIKEQAPELKNSNVVTRYTEWKYQALYERVKKRAVLEEISEFLSPLKLKQKLIFETTSCGAENAFYSPDTNTVHLCYEIFDWIENVAAAPPDKVKQIPGGPPRGLLPGITRAEAIVGAIGGLAMHETGHAVFDIQQIPRLGREEDAADMVAGFVMLQFGSDVARTMIKGTFNMTYNWHAETPNINSVILADTHSLGLQRGISILCLAYGKDPETFKDLAQAWLPPARQPSCAREYRQAENAFRKTILPDVDPIQLKKVQQMKILRPDDNKL
jgi:Putative metallopeptidase